MKVERVLIEEDKLEYRNDLHKLEYWIIGQHGKKIEKAFERTGLGVLNDDHLSAILAGDLYTIRAAIRSEVEKILTPEYFGAEIARNVAGKTKQLEDATADLHDTVNRVAIHDLLEYLSVNEKGHIVVSDESKDALLEAHRQYLYTEEGIKRYDLHRKAVKAINAFKNAMGDELGSDDVLQAFDLDDDDNVIPVIYHYE